MKFHSYFIFLIISLHIYFTSMIRTYFLNSKPKPKGLIQPLQLEREHHQIENQYRTLNIKDIDAYNAYQRIMSNQFNSSDFEIVFFKISCFSKNELDSLLLVLCGNDFFDFNKLQLIVRITCKTDLDIIGIIQKLVYFLYSNLDSVQCVTYCVYLLINVEYNNAQRNIQELINLNEVIAEIIAKQQVPVVLHLIYNLLMHELITKSEVQIYLNQIVIRNYEQAEYLLLFLNLDDEEIVNYVLYQIMQFFEEQKIIAMNNRNDLHGTYLPIRQQFVQKFNTKLISINPVILDSTLLQSYIKFLIQEDYQYDQLLTIIQIVNKYSLYLDDEVMSFVQCCLRVDQQGIRLHALRVIQQLDQICFDFDMILNYQFITQTEFIIMMLILKRYSSKYTEILMIKNRLEERAREIGCNNDVIQRALNGFL